MTNGIAVNRLDGSFDLWLNKTCTSGYLPRGMALINIFRYPGTPELWADYSPLFNLAVPEQVVWWDE